MYTMRDQVFDAIQKYGATPEAAAYAAENYFLAYAMEYNLPYKENLCKTEEERIEMVCLETTFLEDALTRVNAIKMFL